MSIRSKALSAAAFPSCAAWNSTPTRRSGQNTSGASSSTVRALARTISPNTSRSPTLTATSATPRVATSSSTRVDRKAMRSVAIAERRWAAPSSAIRPLRAVGAAQRPQRRDAGDEIEQPGLQGGHRGQRRRRALRGGQPDQDHEHRDQRQRDQHDRRRPAGRSRRWRQPRPESGSPPWNKAGRYAVKYGRSPSSPRTTTVAASSRRCASTRGSAAVTERNTAPPRSAMVALAPRWPSRACSHWSPRREWSTAPTGSAAAPSSGPGVRVAGSVMTPATR